MIPGVVDMNFITEKDEGFAGTLENVQLNDLIQICCLSAVNVSVQVKKGSHKGTIFIKDGDVVHAVCEECRGEDAFYNILSWKRGSFETLSTFTEPEVTITKGWQYLLLEAARIADEKIIEEEKRDESAKKKSGLRVIIVDDSSIMCRILKDMLTAEEDIEVIGTAKNGEEALGKINELRPDLITLDVNMPVMNGNTALKHIMIRNPCPVIIISSLGLGLQENIFDFLRLGAVDFVNKPGKNNDISNYRQKLIETVRIAAEAKINNFQRVKFLKPVFEKKEELKNFTFCTRLVVINSGAGGYAELIRMIPLLPLNINLCFVLFQKMPVELAAPLSDYLNKRSSLTIIPLYDDAPLIGGRIYISSSCSPVKLVSMSKGYLLSMKDAAGDVTKSAAKGKDNPTNYFDAFLHSIADRFSGSVVVVLLSGADLGNMEGLQYIKEKNVPIIAQRLDSCLVDSPLKKAVNAQLVCLDVNFDEIVKHIMDTK